MERLHEKLGYKIKARSGVAGKVRDFVIDEQNWKIKYIVNQTGLWLKNRKVLIPSQILRCDVKNKDKIIKFHLPVAVIKNFPDIEERPPVSLEQEQFLSQSADWLSGLKEGLINGPLPNEYVKDTLQYVKKSTDNPTRSFRELKKYSVHTKSGDVEKLDDLVFDPETWEVTHVIVKSKQLLKSVRILIAVDWITKISWAKSEIDLGLSKNQIKLRMEYIPETIEQPNTNRIKEYLVK